VKRSVEAGEAVLEAGEVEVAGEEAEGGPGGATEELDKAPFRIVTWQCLLICVL
jgi:hypothetical protein